MLSIQQYRCATCLLEVWGRIRNLSLSRLEITAVTDEMFLEWTKNHVSLYNKPDEVVQAAQCLRKISQEFQVREPHQIRLILRSLVSDPSADDSPTLVYVGNDCGHLIDEIRKLADE